MSIIKANQWQKTNGTVVQAPLQVAIARTDSTFSTSSTSYVDITPLAVTLTPSSVNSRFFVQMQLYWGTRTWNTNGCYIGCRAYWSGGALGTILGNGSAQWQFQYGADNVNTDYEMNTSYDCNIVTPGTTNPVTFQAQFASMNASYVLYLNRSYGNYYGTQTRSTLTVWELAA
jgi:hypothetical protein